jgi:hypothetical protein
MRQGSAQEPLVSGQSKKSRWSKKTNDVSECILGHGGEAVPSIVANVVQAIKQALKTNEQDREKKQAESMPTDQA